MVLGGDDALMDKACGTILRERKSREDFKSGIWQPRRAQVCGQQVSVLKTPSYWLDHLKSHLLFSNGVKSLKKDLKFFESLLFPGPHAFLLVHRDVKDSGRENYLLQALSDVFGEKVLDYCMVLFIDQAKYNHPKLNSCVKMCGNRYHILYNTDDSVKELFKKNSRRVFTKDRHRVRAAENYFEALYEERENKLRKELAENKETTENLKKEMLDMRELNKRIEDDLKKSKDELETLRRSRENQMMEEVQRLKQEHRDRENVLSNELDTLKSKENQMREKVQRLKEELSIRKDRNTHLKNKLNALEHIGNQTRMDFQRLNEELIIYKDTQRELNNDKERLKKQIEQLEDNEKQQQKNLTEAKRSESESNITKGKGEEEVQAKERELNEREKELNRRVKELDDRQRNLHEREKDLEIRERGVTQRDHHLQATADPPPAGEYSQSSVSHSTVNIVIHLQEFLKYSS